MARITSRFGFTSTAGDVTRGVDLGGRRIVVTGGGSGLRRATALALARDGAQVTIAVRTPAEPPDPAIRVARLDHRDTATGLDARNVQRPFTAVRHAPGIRPT
jgi:NAD(P)-dependent dehydrogenase (short-subunit alcohol dehydrogenase family)